MKQFFDKAKKGLFACAVVATSAVALAEGEAAEMPIKAEVLEKYITGGQSQVVTLLTAGAAIVGAFFIWRLLKKALNASK